MLIGFARWVPLIVTLRNAERDLTKANESLLIEISVRWQAEKALAQFREILETTTDFVGIADKQGRLIYMNPAGRRMVGIGEDEDVLDTTIQEYHPKWATALLQQEGFTGAIRDGMWAGETAFLSRDGREVPVSMVLLAHKSLDGEVEFFQLSPGHHRTQDSRGIASVAVPAATAGTGSRTSERRARTATMRSDRT